MAELPFGFVIEEQPEAVPLLDESQAIPEIVPSEIPIEPVLNVRTTAQREADEILGVDSTLQRGTILPFAKNAQGETVFAIPAIALDVARSILLPGQAMEGTPVTVADTANMALETMGAPAARGMRAVRTPKRARLTAQQIADAPSALDLSKASGKKFEAARQAGAALKADDFVGFLAGAERDLIEEGIDSRLHPKLTAVFSALTKRVGDDLDASDLHKIRRTIGIATESAEPDEARIARVLRDNFDDFVENLPGTDKWKEARATYVRARKAETVEEMLRRADNAASGLENGLRIEARKLLNNPRRIRNFTQVEKNALKAVVDGDFTTNTLRKIGKIGSGTGSQTSTLGLLAGIGAGGILGGPVGSIAAPVAGQLASKRAERNTMRAASILRALVTGVRPDTPTVEAPRDLDLLRNLGTAATGVTGAALIPDDSQ